MSNQLSVEDRLTRQHTNEQLAWLLENLDRRGNDGKALLTSKARKSVIAEAARRLRWHTGEVKP